MRTYPFELELFLSDCSPWISRLDEIDDSPIEIIQENHKIGQEHDKEKV
jgi:hypothetical protein